MSKDTTSIFRVIDGGNAPAKHRRTRVIHDGKKKHKYYKWECALCENESGRCSQLKQIRVGAFVDNGRLYAGEIWWACERCGEPVALIRRLKHVPDED